MANGSHKAGPAQADRVREEVAKRGHWLGSAIDAIPDDDDGDSPAEVTGSWKGLTAKAGLPRQARLALGYALSGGVLALLLAFAWAIARR